MRFIRMKKKNIMMAALSVLMAGAMTVSFVFGEKPVIGDTVKDTVSASARVKDVTGTYDTSGLDKGNFNTDVVKKNDFASEAKGEIGVIVDLGGNGLYDIYDGKTDFSDFVVRSEARKYGELLEEKQEAFLSALNSSGISYTYKYSYKTINNAVSLRIDASDYKKVKALPGVVDLFYSQIYAVPESIVAVNNNANVYSTGVYNSSDVDYKGEGMVVAVLDTGLDASHDAFRHMPTNESIWTKEYVAERLPDLDSYALGYGLDDVYYNEKVPYAFDYADDDPNVFPSYSTHGTHVAGIIAGRDENKVVDRDGNTFIGVAPEAQLAIMKVFTDNLSSKMLGGADTIDILRALNDCASLGVDVINMSLGSSCGFSDEKSDDYVTSTYERIENLGISLVVAAGNEYSSGYGGSNGTNLASNPDSGTVGSPSTYGAALSVASIAGQESPYFIGNKDTVNESVAFITNSSDGNNNEIEFLDTLYKATNTDRTQELTLNYVVVGGVGRAIDYTTAIKNQLRRGNCIALIKRGDNTFAEKVKYAMSNGAVACIIYNNVSGTIRMSLGEVVDPIPTCSISMDAGNLLVNAVGGSGGTGKITFAPLYTAGPFMSDFSSWGPTPDLKLKPEITAYGGNILSAVPGGYDQYSGTSMATPNMAGIIALLRQYLKKSSALEGKELNALVNQMLMSTATMVLNEEGNPYSPRKQGAGLGSLADAVNSKAYITVGDSDKAKVEFGEDKAKKGVYETTLTVHNITSAPVSYSPKVYTMTETLASDNKTVAEKSHMLNDSVVTVKANGKAVNGDITVPANGSVDVTVKIELGKDGRAYIDNSFPNGMYVEGFIRFEGDKDTVGLGVPYLAYYGDWSAAPMFDYTIFEVSADENDNSIEEEDKRKASAAATTPYGRYEEDYIIPLGSYVYKMAETDVAIPTSDEHAAISMFSYDYGPMYSINELTMIYAGLLRGAKTMDVDIVDAATGETVYRNTIYNLRKGYAGGGGNYGSQVSLKINPYEWGWNNNTNYVLTLKGSLDWEGETNGNEFSFRFAVDYEAPVVTDYRIRYESYVENNETKYRIYMDVDVYDNNYAMSLMPCYIEDNELKMITQYALPLYSQKNSVTTVSYEITDYYDQYYKTGDLCLYVLDYAMNRSVYQCIDDDAITYPESMTFDTSDGRLKLRGTESVGEYKYNSYSLTMSPNEAYKLTQQILPVDLESYKLNWTSSSDSVKVQEGELFAVGPARNVAVTVYAGKRPLAKIIVQVGGEALEEPLLTSVAFEPIVNGLEYVDSLSSRSTTLKNNTQTQLLLKFDPWYITDVEFEWKSSNERVLTVDQNGVVSTHQPGVANVTASAVGYSRMNATVRVTVDDNYDITNYCLYEYYGGPEVVIPEDRNVMYLDDECFRGNTKITSVTLPSTLTQIPEMAFAGCTNLKYVFINGKCVLVSNYAFDGCTALETVEFGKQNEKVNNVDSVGTVFIGYGAFNGCTNLKTIINAARMTTVSSYAFNGCTALTSIDISGIRVAENYIFNGCMALREVTTSKFTVLGKYMFNGCSALTRFEVKQDKLPEGVFSGCYGLKEITFAGEMTEIGGYAFYKTGFTTFTLPNGALTLGDHAFAACDKLETLTISENTRFVGDWLSPFADCSRLSEIIVAAGNTLYAAQDGILYNKDKTTLLYVPTLASVDAVAASVTQIGASAFVGKTLLRSYNLSGCEGIGAYSFAGTALESVTIPASWTEIPDGLFYSCKNLTSVTFENGSVLEKIGASAFEGCTALKTVALPGTVKSIGDSAFRGCAALSELNLENVTRLGDYALAECNFTSIEAPKTETLGSFVFGGNKALAHVTLGPVTQMGGWIFMIETEKDSYIGIDTLESVVFGEGTTQIGEYALACGVEDENLVRVVLPATVKTIGRYAFYNRAALCNAQNEFNLGGVVSIGELAFAYCASLDSLDLTEAEEIGAGAFVGTKALQKAELSSALDIGASAFEESGLKEVSLPKAEKIGSYAFASTQLKSVTVPASLASFSFDDEWLDYNEAGDLEPVKGKKTPRTGSGVFQSNKQLTAIVVESGNPVYFAEEGVLYAKVADGYVLVQYPAQKAGDEYTVRENTVRIGDGAFYGVEQLKKVNLPASLRAIGSFAFYASSVEEYVFTSVEAPALETEYLDPLSSYVQDEEIMQYIFGMSHRAHLASTMYYSNFNDFVARSVMSDSLRNNFDFCTRYYGDAVSEEIYNYQAPASELKMTCPENGTGYDGVVWRAYFPESLRQTSEYAPDAKTLKAIAAIDKAPSVRQIDESVAQGTAAEKLAKLNQLSGTVMREARNAFDAVTVAEQLAFIRDKQKLFDAEAHIRALKEGLGAPVALTELQLKAYPDKYEYNEGETFDPAGMVITAVYEDGSKADVKDYTLSNSGALTPQDTELVVSYGGKEVTVYLAVTAAETPDVPTPPTPPVDSSGDESSASSASSGSSGSATEKTPVGVGLIVAIAAGAVVAVGAVVLVVVLVVRKKK